MKIGSVTIKERAYKALVESDQSLSRPALCGIRAAYTAAKDVGRVERVQRRAAPRWVVNRHRQSSSVEQMYSQLQWAPLRDRRLTAKLATRSANTTTGRLPSTHNIGRPSIRQQEPPASPVRRHTYFLPARPLTETVGVLPPRHQQVEQSSTRAVSNSALRLETFKSPPRQKPLVSCPR